MKRNIALYTAILAAVLFVSGCKFEEHITLSEEGLTISLKSDSPVTRADEVSFEDVIDHFDFFFFKDAAGTQPVAGMHGRATGSSVTLATGEGQAYGALHKITSYVYILANYNGTLSHTSDWTLPQLLALPVNDSIVTRKVLAMNEITGEMEETGAVELCSSLVMDSWQNVGGTDVYTTELTPVTFDEARTVNIGLSRIAAKLTLTVNVPASATGTLTDETWSPSLKDLRVYYVNALNNKSTVSAAPIRRNALADTTGYHYLTYPTLYPIEDKTAPGSTTHTYLTAPVYTYPQTWLSPDNGEPYFKIQLPWVSNIRGSAPFYYKVTVPKPTSGSTWTIDRNTYYNATVDLTVIDTENEYAEVTASYIVAPWAECSFEGSVVPVFAKFFDVPQTEFVMYSNDDLSIAFSSSSAVEAFFTDIQYSYYGEGARSYDFSFAEADKISTVTLPTSYNGTTIPRAGRDPNAYSLHIENGKTLVFSHSLSSLYTVRNISLVLRQIDNPSNRKVITIVQHPAIELVRHSTKNAFVNGYFGRATKDVKDGDGNLIGHDPFTPTNTPDPEGRTLYHSYNYASPAATTADNTDRWSRSSATSKYISLNTAALGNLGTVNGDVSTSAKDCYTFEIIVSAFNDNNKSFKVEYRNATTYNGGTGTQYTRQYRIGDPRVPASQHYPSLTLPNYLYSDRAHRDPETDAVSLQTADVTRAWEEPLKILIANQNTTANEVIAPRFLVSSPLNVMYGSISHDSSVKRAMTYQENGYPAGRWRLPTEAEIAFIVARQKEGVIPWLFAGTYYHCANKRVMYVRTGDSYRNDPPISVQPTNGYNRFVYDLWYWGDEQMTDNVYHPNMHEH